MVLVAADVVLAMITEGDLALQYASENSKSDRNAVLAIATKGGSVQQDGSGELQTDREVVSAAATRHDDTYAKACICRVETRP